ncbi:hypothetical protein ABKN59_000109 [Abortiporus biennis]
MDAQEQQLGYCLPSDSSGIIMLNLHWETSIHNSTSVPVIEDEIRIVIPGMRLHRAPLDRSIISSSSSFRKKYKTTATAAHIKTCCR